MTRGEVLETEGRDYLLKLTEHSQKLPSLQQVLEAPEDLVFQEVQQAQRYQPAPSHQENPGKVQHHNGGVNLTVIQNNPTCPETLYCDFSSPLGARTYSWSRRSSRSFTSFESSTSLKEKRIPHQDG